METAKYLDLSKIVQNDFTVKSGVLFYKGKQISSHGKLILKSSEEAFFHFEIEDKATKDDFSHVFLLNCRHPRFYKATDATIEKDRFQFISPVHGYNAFRIASYNNSRHGTKIVGDNYHK